MGAAGVLSVGAGTAYLGIGTYRGIDSAIKSHKLGKIEQSYKEPKWNYGSRDIVGRAAGFGKETKQASTVAYAASAAMSGTMIRGWRSLARVKLNRLDDSRHSGRRRCSRHDLQVPELEKAQERIDGQVARHRPIDGTR